MPLGANRPNRLQPDSLGGHFNRHSTASKSTNIASAGAKSMLPKQPHDLAPVTNCKEATAKKAENKSGAPQRVTRGSRWNTNAKPIKASTSTKIT